MRLYIRSLHKILSFTRRHLQPYRCVGTASQLMTSNENGGKELRSAVIDDDVYRDLKGSKVNYENRKAWVGFNPFRESVPSDWIGFLSQQIDWDTYLEDRIAAKYIANLRRAQAYHPERIPVLGGELVAARFAVFLEGKVKLHGDDHWYCRANNKIKKLPEQKTLGLAVEAIDLSGTSLIYEGVENLFTAKSLLHLNLSNCDELDEWGISRLAMIPSLVSLDLSNNNYVTERSLIPLQFLPELRKLNLSGVKYFTNQPLSLIFLEELLPNCVIVVDEKVDSS